MGLGCVKLIHRRNVENTILSRGIDLFVRQYDLTLPMRNQFEIFLRARQGVGVFTPAKAKQLKCLP